MTEYDDRYSFRKRSDSEKDVFKQKSLNLEERKRLIKQNQKLHQESVKHEEDEFKLMYESLDKISIGNPHTDGTN